MIELQIADIDQPALVDCEFSELQRYRWRLDRHGYVFRHGDFIIPLHHVIMPSPPATGLIRDHINRDKLDNRRINLRWLTYAESNANRGAARSNATSYRGVRFDEGRGQYLARIQKDGKAIVRKWFDDAAAANEYLIERRKKLLPHSYEAD